MLAANIRRRAPASCSRKIPMICSSLNRLRFIVRLLSGDGLYPNLEEFSGLRSTGLAIFSLEPNRLKQPDYPKANESRAEQYARYGLEDVKGADARVVRGQEAAPSDPRAQRNEWRQEEDLKAQWEQAKWAKYAVWAAVVTVAVTALGVAFVALTLKATRDAVREAEKAAQAAQDSVRLSARIGRQQSRNMRASIDIARKSAGAAEASARALPALERGYVFFKPQMHWGRASRRDGVDLALPYPSYANAYCIFTNHGRTPVILRQYEADLQLLSKIFGEPDNTSIPMPILLFPGGQLLKVGDGWSPEPRATPLMSEQLMETVGALDTFVWFYGCMTYEDVFGVIRHTRFRWRWEPVSRQIVPQGGRPYNERS